MIVSFLDLKIKLDVSCSQDDIPHSFRIQCNQMEDHKKYNHRQQVPSSAYHFSAKDSMLVQSRWLDAKPFVAHFVFGVLPLIPTPHNPSTMALLLNAGQGGIPKSLKWFKAIKRVFE